VGSFGQLTVCMGALFSAAGGALVLSQRIDSRFGRAGYKLLHAAAAATSVSLFVLLFLLLSHDYRIAYVRDYADKTMTTNYLLTALWGGREGSLLLWAALQCWFTSAVVIWTQKSRAGRELVPIALGFLAALQVYFLVLVLFHSNPFAALGAVAVRGIGMNPLLRNPYMAVHPPTLYLGFVGFSVPMAFAIAALAEGRVGGLAGREWIAAQRPWILVAWFFLSIGNLLGMVWAYQELGWGGYWGWDPVENASFMPWLTSTALVHSMMVTERRGVFRIWNLVLIVLTFLLIIFGTFLTRSGVIQSVHAFAGATAGPYLLGLIVTVAVVVAFLFIVRWRSLMPDAPAASLLSKEGTFALGNWAFVISAAFVWTATMMPLFAQLFSGDKVAVTPEFYNRWMVPLGLGILALIGACAAFAWRANSPARVLRHLSIPVAVGAVCAIAGVAGGAGFAAVMGFGLLGFVGTTVLREIARPMLKSKAQVTAGRFRKLGGRMVHMSVVLLFLGFTGSAFTADDSDLLRPGEVMQIGNYSLRFVGLRDDSDFSRRALFADIDVRKGNNLMGILSPARFTYHSHPGQPTSEVVINTGIVEDLFLILGQGNTQDGSAVIRAVINPLVIWIWIGGVLLVLGTIVALWRPGWLVTSIDALGRNRKAAIEVGGGACLVVAIVCAVGVTKGLDVAMITCAGIGLAGALLLMAGAFYDLARRAGET
jgi:cytochrome c-type biogenesis protein CcmF